MSTPHVVDFKDVVRKKLTTSEIGGKGMSLGKMTNLFDNLVPFGCCVTTESYEEHLRLQCRIDMASILHVDMKTMKMIAEKIRSTPLSSRTRSPNFQTRMYLLFLQNAQGTQRMCQVKFEQPRLF